MNKMGLTHIYCGDGKGKTTAAMGLALRAAGYGANVVVVQFLKDGDSSEVKALRTFPNVTVIAGKDVRGFSNSFDEAQRRQVTKNHNDHLREAIALCEDGKCDMLILDEAMGALSTGMLDEKLLMDFLKNRPEHIEVVMTGRNPGAQLLELADYVSDIRNVKHPYDKGIPARPGVEK